MYALMLNVDWMQPFEHTTYSVGVMYLVLMNLPRHERFKRENVILVGLIPGPSEPQLNINTYLSPLVDELLILWSDGTRIRHAGSQLIPEQFRRVEMIAPVNKVINNEGKRQSTTGGKM